MRGVYPGRDDILVLLVVVLEELQDKIVSGLGLTV